MVIGPGETIMGKSAVGELVAASGALEAATKKKALMGVGQRTGRKWIVALLALLVVIAVLMMTAYLRSRPVAAAFRTARVVRADITQRVTATGTLQPVITSPVGAQVSGIVWKLHADFNSPMKAGDVLVQKTQVAAVANEALRFRPTVVPGLAPAEARLGSSVYVQQGDSAVRVPIKIGVTDGNMTEVEGLALGREVIIDVARDTNKGAFPAAGGPGRGF